MYHLIDFADFNIPPGLKVVGSKVLLKYVVGPTDGDIAQFVIVDDLSMAERSPVTRYRRGWNTK